MKKQEHPYSELYVEDAMTTVAFSFDYAVRASHYVAGMSGCELALEICERDDGPKSHLTNQDLNIG